MRSKVERVARLAMALGGRHMSEYGAAKSRHDFTQRQLMACLVLRAYLKTTYRGVIDFLEGHVKLREILGMEEKLPHYTTLQKFSARSQVLEIAEALIAEIGQAALRAERSSGKPPAALVMDATGMETTLASAYYTARSGRDRRCKWVKLSLSVLCGSLLPVGVVFGWGPTNDRVQARELLEKSVAVAGEHRPSRLYADAGYDARWIHALCRERWAMESIIKPSCSRRDGTYAGPYRSAMTAAHLKEKAYGRRWNIESFFSGLKRTTGSALSARSDASLLKEAALRLLTYTLNR